jgi:hypothetical protein
MEELKIKGKNDKIEGVVEREWSWKVGFLDEGVDRYRKG